YPAGRDASAARNVHVLVVGLDLLRRDDREGAEAEVEVLLHVYAVVNYLGQLLGGEADAVEPSLELFERGKALDQFSLRVRDLLLGGVRVRELRSLLQDEPLVYHHVERPAQVLLPWA